jgi:hypothetical protein
MESGFLRLILLLSAIRRARHMKSALAYFHAGSALHGAPLGGAFVELLVVEAIENGYVVGRSRRDDWVHALPEGLVSE